jgi:hypothetical protein
MKEPTKAQAEILQFLWNSRRLEGVIRGGDLVEHYHTREIARLTARYLERGKPVPAWIGSGLTAGSGQAHSWRRTGGLQLKRMAQAGILDDCGFSVGVPIYEISAEGFDWVEANLVAG